MCCLPVITIGILYKTYYSTAANIAMNSTSNDAEPEFGPVIASSSATATVQMCTIPYLQPPSAVVPPVLATPVLVTPVLVGERMAQPGSGVIGAPGTVHMSTGRSMMV